jgi:hypothetical protein
MAVSSAVLALRWSRSARARSPLSHSNNTFSGGTLLKAGTFNVTAQGAAGDGWDKLRRPCQAQNWQRGARQSCLLFGTTIFLFAAGDTIDLPGLRFHTHAKATYDIGTGELTVHSGHVTDTLSLALTGTKFKALDDGHGGTKVVLVVPHAKPVAQAAAERQVSEHQGDGHRAVAGMLTAFAADSFHFNSLAGLGGIDRGWTPDLHFGHGQHETSLDAGSHGRFSWTDPSQADLGHHAHMLSGHDFIL